MRKFDLKQLRNHFTEIGEIICGQTLQLENLKKVFVPVRNNKEELSLKHLMAVRDDYAFGNWWKMPEISEDDFLPLKGILTKLKPQDEEVISKLFDLLKNIEIASCILRSIDPQNYGIMSPPVENLLNVKGKRQIEKYLNYLQNLEELKKEYKFVRIADVDMALWALANILNYPELRAYPKYQKIYEDYRKRTNLIKKIMAINSLSQIWQEKGYVFIAELFLGIDHEIAGIIAGREIERFVHNQCEKHGIEKEGKTEEGRIKYFSPSILSDILWKSRYIRYEEYKDIKKWWALRNKLTHKFKIFIARDEVEKMIEGIINLTEKYKK